MTTTSTVGTRFQVTCDECGKVHEATPSHVSETQGQIYAVVCTGTDEWLTDYYTDEVVTEHLDIRGGDIVVGKPIGQSRRQTVKVISVDIETGLVFGWLVSKKYEDTYRGQANLFLSAVESAERSA